jgi:outer membrane lipoprotein carrier protein
VTISGQRKAGSRVWGELSFLLALLLFAACLPVAGQQVAPSANDLAKRVDGHYNHLQSLKASFKEQYDGLGMHRSESGVMMLRKPGRMRWEYQSTAGKVFVLDGKYAWFYSPGDTQVQRIAASQLDDLRSPLRFLLGHTKIESELQGLTLAAGPGATYTLSGQPRGEQKKIAKLSLTVTSSGAIAGILIVETDGAETRFDFTDEVANAAIPEAAFHFAPPAGVPVVDALPPV